MGTKTISLKDEAYKRLKAARRYPDESFSEVVLRATWAEDTITAKGLLSLLGHKRAHLRADELDRIDAVKATDRPPEDKWAGR
jgi:predicted CopG family antitoxin